MVTVPQFSYKYRMGAGFPGDVNRTHPASVEPAFNDATAGVPFAGLAALINSGKTGVRGVAPGDTTVTTIYGVSVRAFPLQQPTADGVNGQQNVGLESLQLGIPIDVLRYGYIIVPVNGTPGKGDPVFVWVAATAAPHTQGGFEAAASAGNTAAITNAVFNGPPDSSGFGEIIVRQP